MNLIRRDENSREFLLFALTPPRLATAADRLQQVADTTIQRLQDLDLDGLILYDIDDEAERNPAQRPFPFTPTLDPADFLANNLAKWQTPVIVYRAVAKHDRDNLRSWLAVQDPSRVLTVLVGAASSTTTAATSLTDAHAWSRELNPDLTVGGVAIPERHSRRRDEQRRLLTKQQAGCRFFVTQIVYDVNAAKNLVSDYFYECAAQGIEPVPIVFTFSVCGSMRTLEFLRWLGVDVPRWIENDLTHSADTLDTSYQLALTAAIDLIDYCRRLGMPFGINIESVSNRKIEIEASVKLAARLRAELRTSARDDPHLENGR